MQEFRKTMDNLPLILKIILALPFIDGIIYGIYRICRGDITAVVLGVIWIFIGAFIGWILDIVFLIMGKPVFEISPDTLQ